ncbi:hypothetical protein EUX98_g8774 [Antrodiella citrinella]|uniref:Decapping nuclease n=1 Tax=Antrodiella citrinella TaxID=2447956 RepID=A0A4S4M2U0_9APHY|nr:hypothetical protein EUX98_g8774 [Antrodiella citrinella]
MSFYANQQRHALDRKRANPVVLDRDINGGLLPTPLKTLNKPSPSPSSAAPIEVKDLVYVASYNWVEAPKPTIIVPGSPSEWQSPITPFRVQPDTGISFVDQAGYRIPTMPLLPLFRAADIMTTENSDADIDWGTLDFVTDRNNLRKLLRCLNDFDGTAKDFRIDMQLAGKKTVLFNRWEKRFQENMSGKTFGFGFEAATTRKVRGCEASIGHHRIVKYHMDDLNLVVRFEVDACMPRPPQSKVEATSKAPKPAPPSSNVDDLSDLLSGLNVSSTSASPTVAPTTTGSSPSDVTIIRAGYEVAQSAIIELTTRSERNVDNIDWTENFPQLFLSQTAHHILGIHARGTFHRVETRRLDSPDLQSVEGKCQRAFKRLKTMLKVIQDLVVEYGERGRLSLVYQGGILKVYKRDSEASCLPDDVMERFNAL